MQTLTLALTNYCYDEDPLLAACRISINKQLAQIDVRVLDTPKLKVGNSEGCIPQNGRWNFNNKTLLQPTRIDQRVVKFDVCCDISSIFRELVNCGSKKGIIIKRPLILIEEDGRLRRAGPVTRVDEMFEQLKAKISQEPKFIPCILPERKNSDIYGPWKKRTLCDFGIVSQRIAPTKVNDQYLTNVLLKINTKFGGINSLLAVEHSSRIPMITDAPTLTLGMDVSHGSPGQSDVPSIDVVVASPLEYDLNLLRQAFWNRRACLYEFRKISIGNPLFRAQLVMQYENQLLQSGQLDVAYKNTKDCLMSLKEKQGVRGLWRGTGINILQKLGEKALKSVMKDVFRSAKSLPLRSTEEIVLSVAATTILYPLEYGYVRLGSDVSRTKFLSFRDVVGNTVRKDGIGGFYKGYGLTSARVTMSSLGVGMMEIGPKSDSESWPLKVLRKFDVASLFLYPLDTMRNRVIVGYEGYRETFLRMLAKEWPSSFIKGIRVAIVAKSVMCLLGDTSIKAGLNN